MSPLSFTLYVNKNEEAAYYTEATNDSGTGNNILGGVLVAGAGSTAGNMRYQMVQISAPIYSEIGGDAIGTVSNQKISNADGLNVVTGTWLWTFTIPKAVNGIPAGSFTVEEFLQNYNIGGVTKKQIVWGTTPALTIPTYESQLQNPSEYVAANSCGVKFPLVVLPESSSGAYFDREGAGFKIKATLSSCALPAEYRSYTVEFDN